MPVSGAARHHQRARHVVAFDAARMLRHQLEAPVPLTVLLREIAAEGGGPVVQAPRVVPAHQPVAGGAEPVAQIVVVAVAETRIEAADLDQRGSAVDRVAGADVVHVDRGGSAVVSIALPRSTLARRTQNGLAGGAS